MFDGIGDIVGDVVGGLTGGAGGGLNPLGFIEELMGASGNGGADAGGNDDTGSIIKDVAQVASIAALFI